MGNVGSEFERAANAFQRGDHERFEKAFERMLELLDLTVEDPKWRTACRLRELLRLREEVCEPVRVCPQCFGGLCFPPAS